MSFYITLPSFPRPSFEDNTPGNFKVRLPNRLSLEGTGWKVGLASITIPNVCFVHEMTQAGISDTDWLMAITNKTGKVGSNYKMKRATVSIADLKHHKHNFRSGVDFFTMLVAILDERRLQQLEYGYKVEGEEFIPLTIKPLGDDFELYAGKDGNETATHLEMQVDSRLAKIMKWVAYNKDGTPSRFFAHHLVPHLRNYQRPETTELTGNALFEYHSSGNYFRLSKKAQWRFVQLNRIFDHVTKRHKRTLYVYSNVGASTIVGDQVVSLLREVEYNPRQAQNDHFHFEPNMIQYHEVLSSDIDTIEVQLTEIDNTLLAFGQGVTTLVLHFKKE